MREAEFTGERVVPGKVEPTLLTEHMARYRFAGQAVRGFTVLDVGCGVGYGCGVLAQCQSRSVLGLDRSLDAILYAREHHGSERVRFIVADAEELPLRPSSFDRSVCFELVEHVQRPQAVITEIASILTSDGTLLLSTPNRLTYRTEPGAGKNPYHVHEFDRGELLDLLGGFFRWTRIYSQVSAEGQMIAHLDLPEPPGSLPLPAPGRRSLQGFWRRVRRLKGSPRRLANIESSESVADFVQPDFFLAVCGLGREAGLSGRFFLQPLDTARQLRHSLAATQKDLEEKRAWGMRLDLELSERRAEILALQRDLDEKIRWAKSLDEELRAREQRIVQLQGELEERTRWALELRDKIEQIE